MESPPPPLRRWWRRPAMRFSVRVLMVLVLAVGAGLGWYVNRVRVQRESIAAIEKAGGKVWYGWQLARMRTPDVDDLTMSKTPRPPWPKWITDRVGPDFYSTAYMVLVTGDADPVMPHVGQLRHLQEVRFSPRPKSTTYGPTDAGMAHLRGLTDLRHLSLGINFGGPQPIRPNVNGKGLAALEGCTRLQILELVGIPLDDSDLAAVRGMTDLRHLDLKGAKITDAGLAHLAGLVELRKLSIAEANANGSGFAHLKGLAKLNDILIGAGRVESLELFRTLPSLASLNLARNPIGDAGLAPASADIGFSALTRLVLLETRVTDAGLDHLRALPKLKSFNAAGTQVTDAGVAAFQKARPGVRVVRVTPPPAPPRKRPAPAAVPKK